MLLRGTVCHSCHPPLSHTSLWGIQLGAGRQTVSLPDLWWYTRCGCWSYGLWYCQGLESTEKSLKAEGTLKLHLVQTNEITGKSDSSFTSSARKGR